MCYFLLMCSFGLACIFASWMIEDLTGSAVAGMLTFFGSFLISTVIFNIIVQDLW